MKVERRMASSKQGHWLTTPPVARLVGGKTIGLRQSEADFPTRLDLPKPADSSPR
jgi:hypothetical protein